MIGTDIQYAKELLVKGDVVAIPTETVYGLAANAYDENAVKKIFTIKGRPLNNPLIVHVGSVNQLRLIVKTIPEKAEILLNKFTPGPLTILLPKNNLIPDIVTAGLPDVAIRIPAHPLTLSLLNQLNFPLAAPSANPFGYISPTTAQHVENMLNGKIPYVLDGGPCKAGIESTIIGFKNGSVIIYRQGIITKEQMEEVVGSVEINEQKKIVSPGMMDSHYSPHTPLILTDDINGTIKGLDANKIGLITYNEYSHLLPQNQQILLFTSDNLVLAAQNLYTSLHEMDRRGYQYIVVKKLPEKGIGIAINDRLYRASQK